MEVGGLWWSKVPKSALPPQRLRPDTRLEHQDPVSHTAQKKREKKREREKERKKERKKQRKKQRKEENKVIKIENFLNIFKNKKVIQENKKERMKRATKQKNKSTNDNKC